MAATPEILIGVFFVDDDKEFRKSLRGECPNPNKYQFLGEAASCQEARDKIPEFVSFQGILVVMMDSCLPDGRGQDIAREFTTARPETLVVSLSAMTLREKWGHANFRKPVSSMPRLWGAVEQLVSGTGKYR